VGPVALGQSDELPSELVEALHTFAFPTLQPCDRGWRVFRRISLTALAADCFFLARGI
jgi:hypothetical protein